MNGPEHGVLLVGGLRTHQPSHAAAFADHPRCRLIAVSAEPDMTEDRSALYRQLADRLGLPYLPDLDEALARDDVDIVSSTPAVEQRGDVTVRCLEAGKHVYLDKPLAGSIEDADAIVAAAEQSPGRTQMVTLNRAAWVEAARRAVTQGRVGRLMAVHAEVLFAKGRAGTVPEGTVRAEHPTPQRFTYVEAKREMFDLGVYGLAMVHALTNLSAESVFAHTGNYFFAEHVSADVEDFGALALKLKGGLTATVLGGRFGWTSHPGSGPQRIVLVGTEGTSVFDGHKPRIELYNDEPDFTAPPVDPLDPMGMWAASSPRFQRLPKQRWVPLSGPASLMARDVAAFVDCIEQGREPEMNAAAAASILEVIFAGYLSAARRQEIALPLTR